MGRPKELMIGFQVEVTGYKGEPGRLDMYTGSGFSPGFFAWAIPSGETTRIGTWSKPEMMKEESCEQLLDRLRSEPLWSERFSECREIGRFCGPIPSGLVKRPMIGRVALFGDAAGLCKPTTGGGIGPGFRQVEMLTPNSATLPIIGLFTSPLGIGPQNLPISRHSEKRSLQSGSDLNLSSNCSQDSSFIISGLLHVPILVVSPDGIAQAKKPGENPDPVYISNLPGSPLYPVTST
jgi:hypothetical protein